MYILTTNVASPENWQLPYISRGGTCNHYQVISQGIEIGSTARGATLKAQFATYKTDTKEPYPMNRTSLVICLAASMVATVGCASKNYVKQQTTPLINKTNELDDLTAKNTKDIKDVDARAQAGIQAVNVKTAEVEQKAQTAGQTAASAQQMADAANGPLRVMTNTVANLDNYHAASETSVKFGFNKDNLTPAATQVLDQLAASISSTKS